MTALTKDFAREYREGVELEFLVKTNSQIYAGALVMLDVNGLLIPGADTASCVFAGVAQENVLGDGTKTCRVRTEGVFTVATAGLTQAVVGVKAYLVDDTTVALAATTTNDILVGRITKFISASQVQVKINSAAQS
jgi:predicted RecA/RadA family phage recombinase